MAKESQRAMVSFCTSFSGIIALAGSPDLCHSGVVTWFGRTHSKEDFSGGMMAPMKEQSDEWISDVLSYIRTGMSNEASFVTPQQVSEVRSQTKSKMVCTNLTPYLR